MCQALFKELYIHLILAPLWSWFWHYSHSIYEENGGTKCYISCLESVLLNNRGVVHALTAQLSPPSPLLIPLVICHEGISIF